MRVVIIGTGNVARVLFGRIGSTAHSVIQVVGRKSDPGEAFAATPYVSDLSLIDRTADLYIVAISDSGLSALHEQVRLPGRLVVHTAGSVKAEVLREVSPEYGVLYPLQTLRSGLTGDDVVIPFLVDGAGETAVGKIESFARDLSGLVRRTNDEERLRLHLAAVVVNNFTNYLYAEAARFCTESGADFALLQPLIEQTALQLRNFAPHALQTGPARRGDTGTMHKHLDLLQNNPSLQELYAFMSKAILHSVKMP